MPLGDLGEIFRGRRVVVRSQFVVRSLLVADVYDEWARLGKVMAG